MIRAAASFLSLIALVAALPAAAQLAPGYSGYSSAPRPGVNAEYWTFLDQIGPCLANQKPEQSRSFVLSPINSTDEAAAFAQLFNRGRNRRNNCMGRYASVSGGQRAHFRGSVAEGLFENLDEDVVEAFIANPLEGPTAITNLHVLARCFVVADPSVTLEFLRRTDVATEGEAEFIMDNIELLSPCLPSDREIELDATDFRMDVAEAAYRAASGLDAPVMAGDSE